MADDADEFLDEADYERHPAFFTKDTPVGAMLAGTVVERPRVIETDDLNGGTSKKLVLAIKRDDGETFSLWVKKGAMATAIAQAAKKATGSNKVREGAKLAVKFTGLGQAKKAGYNPPKQWAAKYEAPPAEPETGADQADIFGDEEEPF